MFIENIGDKYLLENEIAIQWLGQAGFLVKTFGGTVVAIDPYLTYSVEKKLGPGFKRLVPPLLEPREVNVDLLLITHHHEDHFDVETVPVIMSSSSVEMICCPVSAEMAIKLGVPKERVHAVKVGDEIIFKDLKITAVFSDHGELAPLAVGFTVEEGRKRIYISGDTAYVPEKIIPSLPGPIDIMIVPINGEYGNLNGKEAANLALDINPSMVIPCHFWTFALHRGDPQMFIDELERRETNSKPYVMEHGELLVITKSNG